jgi:hypothetical protein
MPWIRDQLSPQLQLRRAFLAMFLERPRAIFLALWALTGKGSDEVGVPNRVLGIIVILELVARVKPLRTHWTLIFTVTVTLRCVGLHVTLGRAPTPAAPPAIPTHTRERRPRPPSVYFSTALA